MDKTELMATLHAAASALGAAPGTARPMRGKVSLTVPCLRPEPVPLRADPARGTLMLDAFLPFVLPGGGLHRHLKAFVAGRHPGTLLVSRNGNLSIGLPAAGDWPAALAALLAMARDIAAMLHADWPDYARGVFAKALA